MEHILVINGPNMGQLGTREPQKYGRETLLDIENKMKEIGEDRVKLTFFQSDNEGDIVSFIGTHHSSANAIIINAAAYTHTSVAIADALSMSKTPYIEVHITNVYARESFRHKSYLSQNAKGIICGLGISGYLHALSYFMNDYQQ